MGAIESFFGYFGVALTMLGTLLALRRMEREEAKRNKENMHEIARLTVQLFECALDDFSRSKKAVLKNAEHASFVRDEIYGKMQ